MVCKPLIINIVRIETAEVGLEFTGKVRVRISVSVAPELAAAVVKALSRR
jgi:hypothetical protein